MENFITKKQELGAAGGWYNCYVDAVGPAEDGKIYIWLRDKAGIVNAWFYANSTIAQNALPVAIAALINRKIVSVSLIDTAAYSRIDRIYITTTS
jgi:hypothetical protein